MPRQKLTDQQKVFVDQYVKQGDQAYAAAKAGYGSPIVRGCELMKKPNVAAAIEARKATREQIELAGPLCSKDLVDRISGRKGAEPSHAEAAKLHGVFWKVWSQLNLEKAGLDLDVDAMSADQLRQALPVLQAELERIEGRAAEKARVVEAIEDGEVPDDAPDRAAGDDVFA